jgi:predicted patatin/cPLA2 family phospholipase
MKVGLVLEGGAMRGMFTAGVLDVFMDEKINIDGIIGVSAGALFGPNYFSNQKGRVIRYSKRFANDKRYMSIFNLIFTGNAISKKFAYYKVTKELDPFDNEMFKKTNKPVWAVATNVETGNPEYLKINDVLNDMEKLRATSAVPLSSRIIKIDNKKYLDGIMSDSIPIEKMQSLGFDKLIVVLTQPYNYKKKQYDNRFLKLIRKKYKKYPIFIEKVENRYKDYNKKLDLIKTLEDDKKIFVIRPPKSIAVKLIERNKDRLQEIYDIGVDETRNNIKDLKKYLKK